MKDRAMSDFRDIVWDYYRDHGRTMPWRDGPSPYNVLVSEFMLQQTQVSRVIVKFNEFIAEWPDWQSLASAAQSEVVRVWKGLGYNRRALWLHAVAGRVVTDFDGELPSDESDLTSFRGIGPNSAGAVQAYAFNKPVVFIETNIRRVFIHHFFPDEEGVHDKDILSLVEQAVDHEHPREWYWALMDYGSYLSTQVVNPNRRSRHYSRQAAFAGSLRQLRGLLLEYLLTKPESLDRLERSFEGFDEAQVRAALSGLREDGFLEVVGGCYCMAEAGRAHNGLVE
jgi:A/G-specific adenine glycosylase